MRRVDRFIQYAVAAARMALEDARFVVAPDNRERCGAQIGSGVGGISTLEDQKVTLQARGPGRVSPFLIPSIIGDMAPGLVSILLDLRGPNAASMAACATGAVNIGEAFHTVRRGDADLMLAGGAEAAITPLAMAGFASARTLSTRNDAPERASRPFDAGRDGFVMAEGAGVLALEPYDLALARGATIYAEIAGYGNASDAYHITSPSPGGEGAVRAMRAALRQADRMPQSIDYINAHGTSTQANDSNETAAIETLFGAHARNVAISSTKSCTGHLNAAAGAVETILCALAIREGIVPPTINYENPDPLCRLDYVPNRARTLKVRSALTNSFGFGGHNASLLLVAPESGNR